VSAGVGRSTQIKWKGTF